MSDNQPTPEQQPAYEPYMPQSLGEDTPTTPQEPAPPPVEQQQPKNITQQQPNTPSIKHSNIPTVKLPPINLQGFRPEIEKFMPFILAILAIITGIIIFSTIQSLQPKVEPPRPVTVVVTPTPSPTPIRIATNVSTTSEFINFVDTTASLAGSIRDFERDDPALSPPSLVLPLGF